MGDGLVGAVEPSGASRFDREAAFWYGFAGLAVLMLGTIVWWAERRIGAPPRFIGWMILAFATAGVVLIPVSGFWVFFAPGVAVLWRPGSRNSQLPTRAVDGR